MSAHKGHTWVKADDKVRVISGPHRGQRGVVQVGGGIARVALNNGIATWFSADRLAPRRNWEARIRTRCPATEAECVADFTLEDETEE